MIWFGLGAQLSRCECLIAFVVVVLILIQVSHRQILEVSSKPHCGQNIQQQEYTHQIYVNIIKLFWVKKMHYTISVTSQSPLGLCTFHSLIFPGRKWSYVLKHRHRLLENIRWPTGRNIHIKKKKLKWDSVLYQYYFQSVKYHNLFISWPIRHPLALNHLPHLK